MKISELEQNSASAARLFEKLIPNAARIFSQLWAECKKSKTDLVELETIWEILKSWGEKTLQISLDRLLGSCDCKKLRKMQARLLGADNTEQVTASPNRWMRTFGA